MQSVEMAPPSVLTISDQDLYFRNRQPTLQQMHVTLTDCLFCREINPRVGTFNPC
jgi:hypothetical protein